MSFHFLFKFLPASFGFLSWFLSDDLVLVNWTSLLEDTLDDQRLPILLDLSSFRLRFSHESDPIIQVLVSLFLDLDSFQMFLLVAMDDMLYHPLSIPKRNLLLRVVVFILEQLCLCKTREQKFFDFLWLHLLKLQVQVFRYHVSLSLQDLRNLNFPSVSQIFGEVFF